MPDPHTIVDGGATAWVLASAALVLLMTPGVAFFYGGMVRRTNVLGIIMQSFVTLAIGAVLWVLIGFTLAFAPGNGLIGDLRWAGLVNPSGSVLSAPGVPVTVFALFQLMFAVVTPALITGATAERWRFGAFCAFIAIWSVVVYAPIAHWVFAPQGWAARWGALDFAGGTVVHANAGAAALAMAILLGRRRGWPERPARPHNLPMVMTGLAMLWFGWLGFNGGSAFGANLRATMACWNSCLTAMFGAMTWCILDFRLARKWSLVGWCSGTISGLVAATPASGFIPPWASILLGIVTGICCNFATKVKFLVRIDDSLDVFAEHAVGGMVGLVFNAFFAADYIIGLDGVNTGVAGGFINHNFKSLYIQVAYIVACTAYSFVVSAIIAKAIDLVPGLHLRASEEAELLGMDDDQHGEFAYDYVEVCQPTPLHPLH